MPGSRISIIPEATVDLVTDIIDFGDMAGRGTPDAVFCPEGEDLVGVLPDFLSCAQSTMVTQRPVARAGPAQDASAPRDLSAELDDFDFT